MSDAYGRELGAIIWAQQNLDRKPAKHLHTFVLWISLIALLNTKELKRISESANKQIRKIFEVMNNAGLWGPAVGVEFPE